VQEPRLPKLKFSFAILLVITLALQVGPSAAVPANWYALSAASIKGVSITPAPSQGSSSETIDGLASSGLTYFDMTYAEANDVNTSGGTIDFSIGSWSYSIKKFSSNSIDETSFTNEIDFTTQPVLNGDVFIIKAVAPNGPGFADRIRYYKLIANVAVGSDTTPPSFTSSSSFSVAENTATSSTAATVTVSENSTMTISSGADAALFDVYFSDNVTSLIKFKTSPNFEAPADSDGDNTYSLTISAADTAGNSSTQAITIAVTDVIETSSFNSFALAGSASAAIYRTPIVINANVNVASKITFTANGKNITGCIRKSTSGSGTNNAVACTWKPSLHGRQVLNAISTPINGSISGTSATPLNVSISARTGTR
jgi:NifU-like protein involved in Fe-S cluster formation